MNRRAFLKRMTTGAAAVALATHVPFEWLPAPVARETALQFLRREWNTVTKGKGVDHLPYGILVSREVFDRVSSELMVVERFIEYDQHPNYRDPIPVLQFKAAWMRAHPEHIGRQVTFLYV